MAQSNSSARQTGRSPEEDFHVAIHEAGHAIVAVALGAQIDTVTIDPNDEHATEGASTNEWLEDAFDECVVYMAGWEAECLIDPVVAERFRPGCEDDFDSVDRLLAKLNHQRSIAEASEQARQLLRENWRDVYVTALDLLHWRTVDGDEIGCLSDLKRDDLKGIAALVAQLRARNTQHPLLRAEYEAELERVLKNLCDAREMEVDLQRKGLSRTPKIQTFRAPNDTHRP